MNSIKKTVMYITHSVDEAILMSDRIVVLSPKAGGISSIHSVDLSRPRLQYFVGIRLGMGMALAVMVASEFIAADDGLGYIVWTSWQILDMDTMFPAIIIVTFIGVSFHHGMKYLEKKYLPWQAEHN